MSCAWSFRNSHLRSLVAYETNGGLLTFGPRPGWRETTGKVSWWFESSVRYSVRHSVNLVGLRFFNNTGVFIESRLQRVLLPSWLFLLAPDRWQSTKRLSILREIAHRLHQVKVHTRIHLETLQWRATTIATANRWSMRFWPNYRHTAITPLHNYHFTISFSISIIPLFASCKLTNCLDKLQSVPSLVTFLSLSFDCNFLSHFSREWRWLLNFPGEKKRSRSN